MSQKRRAQKLGLTLVTAGALSLSTWAGADARPFGLLLGGGFHHLGGFHHFGGFGGGLRPGVAGGFRGGPLGFRQAGLGYPGFGQAGVGYRGIGSGSRRSYRGSGRGRSWGAYGAAAAVGAAGAYSSGYPTTNSDNGGDPAYGYGYPAYRYYGSPAYAY
jgi:hypothetical protein